MKKNIKTNLLTVSTGVLATLLVGGVVAYGPTALSYTNVATQARGLARTGGDAPAAITVQPRAIAFVCPPAITVPPGLDSVAAATSSIYAPPSASHLAVVGAGSTTDLYKLGTPAPLDVQARLVAKAAVETPLVALVTPDKDADLQVAGLTVSRARGGELAGLAVGSCVAPAAEQWLVGGSTELLHTAKLTISNPSQQAASVKIDIFGALGEIPTGSRGVIALAAGESVALQLEALAPEQTRLAVRVQATGALVTSSIQTTALDGLHPLGISHLDPMAAPVRDLNFVGVISSGEAIDEGTAPTLRLLSPNGDATATISVFGPKGEVRLRGGESVELGAGRVHDVSLGGLPAGQYAVVLSANQPLVGAVRMTPTSTAVESTAEAGDVPAPAEPKPKFGETWLVPSMLASSTSLVVPPDLAADIVLTGLGSGGTAQVSVTGKQAQELKLEPNKVQTVRLDAATEARVVTVTAPHDTIGWSAILRDPANSALTAALTPSAALPAPGQVKVRQVPVTAG